MRQKITKFFTGVISLVKGMKLTMGYLIDPRTIVTQQYPENRDTLEMFPRFRGGLTMLHDENENHNCTGCGICERSCPNGSISVLNTKSLSDRKVLGKYIYRFSQCTFCNLCIESCPFGAIAMTTDYEFAVYDRDQLTLTLNKTEGRG